MAEIAFPASAKIIALDIEPVSPGQLVHRSLFSGSVQVLDRGHATWQGMASLGARGNADETDGKAIEAFLAALAGQKNWTALPLNRPTIAVGTSATVASLVNATDGSVHHNISAAIGVEPGDWLASGSRVYVVRATANAGVQLTLDPQVPLAIGDSLGTAPTIRARARTATPPRTRRTPDFWGPWRFDWAEAI